MTSPLQKKLKITGPSIVTANRTSDGVVIFRTRNKSWSQRLEDAAVVRTADEAQPLLSEAIADPAADLDKDGQTSLLEAWLAAAQRTADFYKNEERLATEHSLLDDNGDGLGTPPDWFQGVRVVQESSSREVKP